MKKIVLAASITGAFGAGLIMYLINKMQTSPKINKLSEDIPVM